MTSDSTGCDGSWWVCYIVSIPAWWPQSQILTIFRVFNHDLREISKWSKQWLFNPDKTVVLYFGNCPPPFLEFNNTVLSTTVDHKNIGVTLSDGCKWHMHINTICSSSWKTLGILRKLSSQLNVILWIKFIFLSHVVFLSTLQSFGIIVLNMKRTALKECNLKLQELWQVQHGQLVL